MSQTPPHQSETHESGTHSTQANLPSVDATAISDDQATRVGSPFAEGTHEPIAASDAVSALLTKEQIHDVGVLRYTAMGSVAASCLVAVFAAIAVILFPVGGILIAALGCVLSLFGLMSSYQKTAVGLLIAHIGMFAFSYTQSLG